MTPDLERRIDLLASDRESGASEILEEAIEILRAALEQGEGLAAGRAICLAQPSMASIWNAALAAAAAVVEPQHFDRFVRRVERSRQAIGSFALDCFQASERDGPQQVAVDLLPLRIVTLSFSRSVIEVLQLIGQTRPVRVSCAEGRPSLEGRRLATRLSSSAVPVTFFTDAAIGHALGTADAVLLGADAVAPGWFLNKSGTRMLAAAAGQQSIPVYVVASRDKFLPTAIAALLRIREGHRDEVWQDAPPGVSVRNPYFETIPLELVATVISDLGLLSPDMVPDVCDGLSRELPPGLVQLLNLSK